VLFDCDESRVWMEFFTWYRGFRVFRLEDGKQIMDLNLPHSPLLPDGTIPDTMLAHNPQFSGVLAASRGVTYVVLLPDGAELEGYRLP
jgi:hypothetical protein